MSRPLRVHFVIDQLSLAGTETQLLALIKQLDRDRVQPTLVLLDGQSEESQKLEPDDCEVIRLGVRKLCSLHAAKSARRLASRWRSERPDVVQTYFLDSGYFALPVAKLCRVPVTLRVRNNLGYFLAGRDKRFSRWVGRLADWTLTNSEQGRLALQQMDGLHPEKILVLENGVDTDRFAHLRPASVTGNIITVGAVANLRPIKNLDGLIRAASIVREMAPFLRFQIAGEGDQRAALQSLIDERNLAETVKLVGACNDVPKFLGELDIAVLCSHSEGMSNALLEYMAAGRIIIATNVGANATLVGDGRHGRIIPPGDDAALASAILTSIRERERSQEMAVAAQQRANEDFGRAKMVRRFENLYRELVLGARRQPLNNLVASNIEERSKMKF